MASPAAAVKTFPLIPPRKSVKMRKMLERMSFHYQSQDKEGRPHPILIQDVHEALELPLYPTLILFLIPALNNRCEESYVAVLDVQSSEH
jgi:hypothetical protein